jgi:hypothetical protein
MANDEQFSPKVASPLLGKYCLSAVFVTGMLTLALSHGFYDSSMINPFLSLAIFSAFIILLEVRRSWSDLLLAVAAGAFLALLDFGILHYPRHFMAWFSFIGMGSFLVMGLHAIWTRDKDRKLMVYAFLPAVLFVASEYSASTLLDITEKLHPKVFDLYLYYFDCSLRVQVSFMLGKILVTWPWFRFACLIFYLALPLPLALVYAARLRQSVGSALPLMVAFLATGPLGVVFYNMLPACGPIHLFGPAFPFHPPEISDVMRLHLQTVLIGHDARNAIPSLHMTWVLLVWWGSRNLAVWIRAIAFTFLAFTAIATVGIGEHYFVDLVVAYPFAVMILALCSYTIPFSSPARRAAFLWGTFATLLWFALLSFATHIFWISPLFPWTMVIMTVAISVVLQAKLQNALQTEIRNEVPVSAIRGEKGRAQYA